MKREQITVDVFREFISYDENTGTFYRKKATNRRLSVGESITSKMRNGYVRIVLFRNTFLAHRVALLMSSGVWPDGCVDHINGQRDDNRLSNLRVVNHSQNQENIYTPKKGNISGFRGVSTLEGKWLARIQVGKRNVRLGLFKSAEEASSAYLQAKAKYHIEGKNGRA